jgi:hypothetical protein
MRRCISGAFVLAIFCMAWSSGCAPRPQAKGTSASSTAPLLKVPFLGPEEVLVDSTIVMFGSRGEVAAYNIATEKAIWLETEIDAGTRVTAGWWAPNGDYSLSFGDGEIWRSFGAPRRLKLGDRPIHFLKFAGGYIYAVDKQAGILRLKEGGRTPEFMQPAGAYYRVTRARAYGDRLLILCADDSAIPQLVQTKIVLCELGAWRCETVDILPSVYDAVLVAESNSIYYSAGNRLRKDGDKTVLEPHAIRRFDLRTRTDSPVSEVLVDGLAVQSLPEGACALFCTYGGRLFRISVPAIGEAKREELAKFDTCVSHLFVHGGFCYCLLDAFTLKDENVGVRLVRVKIP